MNEEMIQAQLEKVISDGKEKLKSAIDDIIAEAYTDILPHACFDTEFNISYRTGDAIRNFIEGRFEIDGDYLRIPCSSGDSYSIRLKLSTSEYDKLRKSLIEVMPECPKDLEIQSLKEQLKRAYERY